MTAIRPAEIDRFLARPDPKIRLVLFYGPDDGLVAERSQTFVRKVVGDAADPFALVRLESNEVADDPGRLADEAHSVPLFGGTRAILLRISGNRAINPSIEAVLDNPPRDAWIAVTAGELRKDAPLRRLCETHANAAAIPCYVDSARDLDRMIDEELGASGLTIAADARALLHTLIGSDRLASRAEVKKLCLYAMGAGTIGIDDIRAAVGDASAFDTDEAVDALLLGDVGEFDRAFRRLLAANTAGFVVGGAVLRQLTFLHRARADYETGTPVKTILAHARPPIFFQRQPSVERQIALWPSERIERAIAHLGEAIGESRLKSALTDEVIGQALTLIGAVATSLRRGRAA
jgi:DNA polymerase-3 subunit delta